jgi:hypothetical protein
MLPGRLCRIASAALRMRLMSTCWICTLVDHRRRQRRFDPAMERDAVAAQLDERDRLVDCGADTLRAIRRSAPLPPDQPSLRAHVGLSQA